MRRTPNIRFAPLIIAAAVLALTGCAEVPIIGQSEFGETRVVVHTDVKVAQEFLSTDRNLSRVDIYFAPSRALVKRTDPSARREVLRRLEGKDVFVRVYAQPERRLVARVKLPARKIRREGMYPFAFPPQVDSKRKSYLVEVSAPELAPVQAVSVRLTNNDRYGQGKAYLSGKAVNNSDLRFLPFIEMNPRMALNSMASRLMADLFFTVFWIVAVAATAVFTVLTWARARGVR